ncbi:hypothetical protein [Mycobacteroides franklinii]|uniref:DNA-binding protein n=1 Tax=Mycobacteroides franklinii TaxID=948102 RepID=A0A4R5P6A4_9MYCO|nr:hypothetical protein [Mycobacteroides franklinii]ORA62167.1 hypothetical protein BST24_08470 [Mycobacteroides franklinii]TDH18966.1 hypothetical protein EJ571_20495 [Mycobacteroides franklinii]
MTLTIAPSPPADVLPARPRNLVSTKVAAGLVGKTEETLRRWHRGKTYDGPRPFRIGGELRWDADEMRAYVETCRT